MGLEEDLTAREVSELFHALSHPRRLVMLECLLDGEKSVGELTRCQRLHPSTQVNISQQLAILRAAGLVRSRRAGNRVIYRVVGSRLPKLLQAGKAFLGERGRRRS